MPIRGVTDRQRIPRLGKIRLGIQVNNAPRQVDHFVTPPEIADALKAQGVPFCTCPEPGPVELPIMFLADDPELIASQYLRAYTKGAGLVCKGDGYTASARLDPAAVRTPPAQPIPVTAWAGGNTQGAVNWQSIECWGSGYDDVPACPMYAAKRCSRMMMLQFAIRGTPGLGVYQLDTGSSNSIRNVNGFLDIVKAITGGRVAGLPLTLKAERAQVQNAAGKAQTVTVIRLDSPFTLDELRAQVADVAQLAAPAAALPPPDEAEAPHDAAADDDDTIETTATDVTDRDDQAPAPADDDAPPSASGSWAGPPRSAPPDTERLRQRVRDLLAHAHATYNAEDWAGLRDALAARWPNYTNPESKAFQVSKLPLNVAQGAVAMIERIMGPAARQAPQGAGTAQGGAPTQ